MNCKFTLIVSAIVSVAYGTMTGPFGQRTVTPFYYDCVSPTKVSGSQEVKLNRLKLTCANGVSTPDMGGRGGSSFEFTTSQISMAADDFSISAIQMGYINPTDRSCNVDLTNVKAVSGFSRGPGMFAQIDKLVFVGQDGIDVAKGDKRAFMFAHRCPDYITSIYVEKTNGAVSAISVKCANGDVKMPTGMKQLEFNNELTQAGGFTKLLVTSNTLSIVNLGYQDASGANNYGSDVPPSTTKTPQTASGANGEVLKSIIGVLWRETLESTFTVDAVTLEFGSK